MTELAQLALALALQEVREQTWATTRQFFGAHTLQTDNGLPVVSVLTLPDRFDIYFHLQGVRYFLVIPVALDGNELALYHCRAEARSRVYLSITSETVTAAEITARLSLEPTERWQKGAPMRVTRGRINHKVHGWFFDPSGDGPGEFDQKLTTLLDLAEPYAAAIRSLSEKDGCSVWVRVPSSGYQEQMRGLGINPTDLQRLAALGAGLDIDLSASGPPLADAD